MTINGNFIFFGQEKTVNYAGLENTDRILTLINLTVHVSL